MNSSALSLAMATCAGSPLVPPRYHHIQPMKTKLTATHTSDQMAASLMVTRWAPWRCKAKKSIQRAMKTKAANNDHINGVPVMAKTRALDDERPRHHGAGAAR